MTTWSCLKLQLEAENKLSTDPVDVCRRMTSEYKEILNTSAFQA